MTILLLYFFLLIWIPFISFSCLIALARTSKMMLNTVGEMGFVVLFLILGEMLSAFHYLVSSRFVKYGLYYIEVCFLCAAF